MYCNRQELLTLPDHPSSFQIHREFVLFMCVCDFFVLYRLVVVGLFLCFPGPRLLFVDNPFGCKRLFVPHSKSYNGTFLLGRIMINIPLGTNITIKVPMDIIFHNLLLDLILWWNLYSVIRIFFFLLISTGNHLIGKCIKNIVDIFGFIQIQRFLRSIFLCSANQS